MSKEIQNNLTEALRTDKAIREIYGEGWNVSPKDKKIQQRNLDQFEKKLKKKREEKKKKRS